MNVQSMKRAEWTVAALLTAAVIVLLATRACHAGGLWRDECGSVQLATMPTVGGIVKNFEREAFPIPFSLLLRGYSALAGTSDIAFRWFGFGVGILMLIVIWVNSRVLATGPPLILLALLGLNATFLVWGTSIRGYGLGSVFILLAFALINRVLLEPSWGRITAAALASLASVQVLLHNSVLLPAFGLAVVTLAIIRRKPRPVMAIIGIGLICVVSMLPYVGSYARGAQWNVLQQGPLTISLMWKQIILAFGEPSQVMARIWAAILLAAGCGAAARLYLTRSKKPIPEWDLLLFALIAGVVSMIGYYAFLKALSYGTRPWYYLALLCVLAGAIDLVIANLAKIPWVRLARLLFASVALMVLPFADWPAVTERQTNIDVVAVKLEKVAGRQDLVVVNPWWLGISFNRYYHGPTTWVTLPNIGDHRIHRFDLVKEKMLSPDPMADLRDLIAQTLRSGNRVWFAGGVDVPEPGEAPPPLPAEAAPNYPWNSDLYVAAWSAQIGTFIQAHLLRTAMVNVSAKGPVNPLEDIPLVGIEGWKE